MIKTLLTFKDSKGIISQHWFVSIDGELFKEIAYEPTVKDTKDVYDMFERMSLGCDKAWLLRWDANLKFEAV